MKRRDDQQVNRAGALGDDALDAAAGGYITYDDVGGWAAGTATGWGAGWAAGAMGMGGAAAGGVSAAAGLVGVGMYETGKHAYHDWNASPPAGGYESGGGGYDDFIGGS